MKLICLCVGRRQSEICDVVFLLKHLENSSPVLHTLLKRKVNFKFLSFSLSEAISQNKLIFDPDYGTLKRNTITTF